MGWVCKEGDEYAGERVLAGDGKLDYHVLKPVRFEMPTYEYLKIGEVIGKCMNFGRK